MLLLWTGRNSSCMARNSCILRRELSWLLLVACFSSADVEVFDELHHPMPEYQLEMSCLVWFQCHDTLIVEDYCVTFVVCLSPLNRCRSPSLCLRAWACACPHACMLTLSAHMLVEDFFLVSWQYLLVFFPHHRQLFSNCSLTVNELCGLGVHYFLVLLPKTRIVSILITDLECG